MIADVHVHLGWDYTFDEHFTRQEIIEKKDEFNIDVQIVQPGSCHTIEKAREQHDAIAGLAREFPGSFFGMANPSPHLAAEIYREEVRRCVQELGFVAIKLHPMAFGVNPDSLSGRKAFQAAMEFRVPLMVHTGAGLPFAGPINLLNLAREFNELNIIMAHCGQIILANEAAAVFKECPNVYGDTSWSPGFILKSWEDEYSPRLMLGSDHADNTGTELAKIRTTGFSPKQQEDILGKTAIRIFNLEGRL